MYVQKMRAELGRGNKNEDQDIILRFFKVMSSYSLCCGNPSSFGQHSITNSTHKQKFKRERAGTVTEKQAENRQWGISVLDHLKFVLRVFLLRVPHWGGVLRTKCTLPL